MLSIKKLKRFVVNWYFLYYYYNHAYLFHYECADSSEPGSALTVYTIMAVFLSRASFKV